MKFIHNPIFIVIDGLNNRVIAQGRSAEGYWHKEWFAVGNDPLLTLVDEMRASLPAGKYQWHIGVYAGPGAFSRLRKGVLLGHWLARSVAGESHVRIVSQSTLNDAKQLSGQWETFPIQESPKIRYGKQPRITKSRKR